MTECAVSAIPYASFTRTAQGTSLVTDVHTLYLLFPTPYDRQSMLICNDELTDVVDYYAVHGGGIPQDYYALYRDHPHGNRSEATGMTAFSPPPGHPWPRVRLDREEVTRRTAERFGVYSLLQVDLRAFRLGTRHFTAGGAVGRQSEPHTCYENQCRQIRRRRSSVERAFWKSRRPSVLVVIQDS
jgi:hypothetical protein